MPPRRAPVHTKCTGRVNAGDGPRTWTTSRDGAQILSISATGAFSHIELPLLGSPRIRHLHTSCSWLPLRLGRPHPRSDEPCLSRPHYLWSDDGSVGFSADSGQFESGPHGSRIDNRASLRYLTGKNDRKEAK